MNIQKQLLIISLILISTGLAIIAPLGILLFDQSQALADAPVVSFVKPAPTSAKNAGIIRGTPRRIVLPSLGIDTAVNDGMYDESTGRWTLSEDSAFYATPTRPIETTVGNTLIYGHNSKKIFGKLPLLQQGATAIVTTDNSYNFIYIYRSTEAVKPTDVSIINYKDTVRLTLQTCSGTWNQTRQMFYFELTSYKKV